MTAKTRTIIFVVVLNICLGLLSGLSLLVGYWLYFPYPPRFDFLETTILTPELAPGGTLVIRRVFRVNEPGGVADIDREIRSVDGKTSYFPPSTGRTYEARLYDTTSYVILPIIPAGEYEYRLTAEYSLNPLRKGHLVSPIVRFRVI
jgi:hypothetical protein